MPFLADRYKYLSSKMMPSKRIEGAKRRQRDDVRIAAREASLRILEPLAEFALDNGLSIRELSSILREAAVRGLAAQQLEVSRRLNISGIAASSGIPRGQISQILNKKTRSPGAQNLKRHEQSTRKILAAWSQDPKFAAANGLPGDLRIYGRGATFEALVKSHGSGIPIRAILDELRRTGAIEVCGSQEIRLIGARQISPQVIRVLGSDARELLTTILQGIRQPENCVSLHSTTANISPNSIPLLRKEISKKAVKFLADVRRSLLRESTIGSINDGSSMMASLVNLTISFREASPKRKGKRRPLLGRQNFRRTL
jgi:transcriptional regulator with XRE-family HTH domain